MNHPFVFPWDVPPVISVRVSDCQSVRVPECQSVRVSEWILYSGTSYRYTLPSPMRSPCDEASVTASRRSLRGEYIQMKKN
jgi:hypothetical protein